MTLYEKDATIESDAKQTMMLFQHRNRAETGPTETKLQCENQHSVLKNYCKIVKERVHRTAYTIKRKQTNVITSEPSREANQIIA